MSIKLVSFPNWIRWAAVVALLCLGVSCGGGFTGTYSSNGEGFFETLTFKPGSKVEITFMGMTKEGTFEREGKQVKITTGGETQVFTIDEAGCLDGGGMIGKYCKAGKASKAKAAEAKPKSGKLSGTYAAEMGGESMAFEFLEGTRSRCECPARAR